MTSGASTLQTRVGQTDPPLPNTFSHPSDGETKSRKNKFEYLAVYAVGINDSVEWKPAAVGVMPSRPAVHLAPSLKY